MPVARYTDSTASGAAAWAPTGAGPSRSKNGCDFILIAAHDAEASPYPPTARACVSLVAFHMVVARPETATPERGLAE
jgi:hypothetical protein